MRVVLQQVVTQSIVSSTFSELTFTWGPGAERNNLPRAGPSPGRAGAFEVACSDLLHLQLHRDRAFTFLEIIAELQSRHRSGVPSSVVREAYWWRSGEYPSSKEVGQVLRRCEECFTGLLRKKDLGWSMTRVGRAALRAVLQAAAAAGTEEGAARESEDPDLPRDG